ncbi:hypothetical protein, partial [Nocardia cyriacigeorgica]|uniref:hypothetical protein n=1 Tax=Nocardia cyriacigeorgica TaxID=135487 RepID=UPI00245652BE
PRAVPAAGTVFAQGPPEDDAAVPEGYTGHFVREVNGRPAEPPGVNPKRATKRVAKTAAAVG